ncbi:hypothetical protein EJB05_18176, partial [Eragrostis curvula]
MEKGTQLASSDAEGRPPLGSVPLLVYDHGMPPNNRQTVFAIGDGSLHTRVVPQLANSYDYHVTTHGWVLLGRRKPPSNWECYLSDAPTSPSCVVLVLNLNKPRFMYCRVGDDRWSTLAYDIGEVPVPPEGTATQKIVIQKAAVVDGKFYFHETRELGVIDFSSTATKTMPAGVQLSGLPRHRFPGRVRLLHGLPGCVGRGGAVQGLHLFQGV